MFTRSGMCYTCSGDPSRFAKLADLLSRLCPSILQIFSVSFVCVEEVHVMSFWKHGNTQKSPLSLSSLLRCTAFFIQSLKGNCTNLCTFYCSFLDLKLFQQSETFMATMIKHSLHIRAYPSHRTIFI